MLQDDAMLPKFFNSDTVDPADFLTKQPSSTDHEALYGLPES